MSKSLITKILIGILVMVLIICLISIIVNNVNKEEADDVSPFVEDFINETRGKLIKVDNLTDLYLVKNCILKYYENYCAINFVKEYKSNDKEISLTTNTAIQTADEENLNEEYFKNVTYQLLSEKYIESKEITKDSIGSEYSGIENVSIEIYNLYYLTKYENVYVYFANGVVRDSESNVGNEFNYIIPVDVENNTFEIYLDGYLENSDFSNLVEGEEINFEVPDNVENREYNTINKISVKYEQAVQDTFYTIRRLMLYDTDKAYSLLTDEMKEKYNSLSEFENYINENKSDIFSLIYGSYKLKSGEDGAIFVIYNANSTVCITVYFDGFSNFKYDIKKL